MRKIAITGISGKNGRELFHHIKMNTDEIKQKWSEVVFNSRDNNRLEFIKRDDFDLKHSILEGDCEDIEFCKKMLRDCDTVLHIAGISTSKNIVDAAIECGVSRLILVHTTGIYSKFKSAGELYRSIDAYVYQKAKEHSIKLTIIRPTMIYGTLTDANMIKFIKIVDKSPFIPVVDGAKYALQPVHCSDLGKAFFDILMNPDKCDGHDYVLSGKYPIDLRDILLTISEELGQSKTIISCPYPIAYIGSWIIYICTLKMVDYREKVQRLCETRAYGYEDAKRDFGYDPMDVKRGIREEVRLYMKTKECK